MLITDKDLRACRKIYKKEFFETWEKGFKNYREGNWEEAMKYFSVTKGMLGYEDGPSVTLLSYMKNRGFKSPSDWIGVRKLTSK